MLGAPSPKRKDLSPQHPGFRAEGARFLGVTPSAFSRLVTWEALPEVSQFVMELSAYVS